MFQLLGGGVHDTFRRSYYHELHCGDVIRSHFMDCVLMDFIHGYSFTTLFIVCLCKSQLSALCLRIISGLSCQFDRQPCFTLRVSAALLSITITIQRRTLLSTFKVICRSWLSVSQPC